MSDQPENEVKSKSVIKREAAQAGEYKELREKAEKTVEQTAEALGIPMAGVGIQTPAKVIEPIWKTIQSFQEAFPGVEKKRYNQFTESNYASLADVWDAAFPHMKGKLWTLAFVETLNTAPAAPLSQLVVCIYNADGDFVYSALPLPNSMESPQKVGSAMKYYRRYLICTMLGIIEMDDDDGNAAEVSKSSDLAISADQLKKINDLIAATKTDAADVLAYIETSYRKAAVDHLSYAEAGTIVKMLEHKQNKLRDAQ